MNLEQRVRDELGRAAPSELSTGRTIDEMHGVVARRRSRNRIGAGVASACVVAALVGGFVATRDGSDSTELNTAGAGAEASTAEQSAPAADSQPGAGADDGAPPADAAPAESERVGADTDAADADGKVDASETQATEAEATTLQAGGGAVTVATRTSAVDFAGGSGVLLVADGSGYAGLASRFGGAAGVTAIGLASSNGLDWSEVALTGVPAGATATALRAYDGTYVALFSSFDVDRQRNNTFVGTSDDLASWDLAPALAGRDTVATDLAVGSAGVVILGTAPAPAVWAGPLGGPYEPAGSIDAAAGVVGIVGVDSGFVAAGVSQEFGSTLFRSADGADWSASGLAVTEANDVVVGLSVNADGLVLAGGSGEELWSALSVDDGANWARRDLAAGTIGEVSAGGSTVSFLSDAGDGLGAVTLSDSSSFSTANIDVSGSERLSLLASDTDTAVLLADRGDQRTWIVVSR